MNINNISFITPSQFPEHIVLEKDYSKEFTLKDGSTISLASKIGIRENQEDCIAVAKNDDYLLLLVSDGMGGLQNGEVASYNTAKIIKKWLETEDVESFKYLNAKTLRYVLSGLMYLILNEIPKNSGATLNMSIVCPEVTAIVNIGDSRTYGIKDDDIKLLTHDDSLAFSIFKPRTSKQRDKLRFFKKNNVISNAIGKDQKPNITLTIIDNKEYDILCHVTDGVSDILEEEQIKICCYSTNPALSLVETSVDTGVIYRPTRAANFNEYIYPKDNASAVVYTKKRTIKK